MGCISSTNAEDISDAKNAKKKNDTIDKQLKKDAANRALEIKLLLLGAGESGKSTIAKQMKIIHNNGYTKDELNEFKRIIYENVWKFMDALLNVATTRKFQSTIPSVNEAIQQIIPLLKNDDNYGNIDTNTWNLIETIWSDEKLCNLSDEVETLQVNQSIKKLLGCLSRISSLEYVPTEKDVLYARVRTSGIVESVFATNDYTFKMYDVGGQRSERRKWIHCFDNVTGLIFVASLADYNITLLEDERTNRMMESLNLFESTCKSPWFKHTSIILFLNKKDMFAEKINKYPLTICFPEYTGANVYDQASDYIKNRFVSKSKDPNREIYVHFTCATDTESVKFVFGAVTDTIIKNNLREYGLY